ncbi:hypothetical protein, partial [Streptomyces sp. NPDC002172]
GGSPHDVLAVWQAALETVIADASVPDLDGIVASAPPRGLQSGSYACPPQRRSAGTAHPGGAEPAATPKR